MEKARADEEEAIIFLAKIIPKKDKKLIRKETERTPSPEFQARHNILGMRTRNALRAGGFFYHHDTMELTWYDWLKKAIYLPEDKIILTESLKKRIKKYRASVRRPFYAQNSIQKKSRMQRNGWKSRTT